MIKFILQIISMFNLVTLIVRVFRWILPTKEEIQPMSFNKEEVATVLNGLVQWNEFLVEVEKAIITVLTDENKQVWYGELFEIIAKLIDTALPQLSEAIEGSKLIGDEWKQSSTSEKIMFFMNILMQHTIAIVAAFTKKPAVETPAA